MPAWLMAGPLVGLGGFAPGCAWAHGGPPLAVFSAYPTLLVYLGAACCCVWRQRRWPRYQAVLLALALAPLVACLAFFLPLFLAPGDAALSVTFPVFNLALILGIVLLARRLMP